MESIENRSYTRPSLFGRLKEILREFKTDLRRPIEGNEKRSFPGRIAARFKFLFKKYGWKIAVAIILYYLIRDTILYIILPYLAAKHLF